MTEFIPNFSINTIETYEDFLDLTSYVKDNQFKLVVLDVETDSQIEKKANLYGIGLCFRDEEAFYIPWRTKYGQDFWDSNKLKSIIDWLSCILSSCKLVGHNILYDILVLKYNLKIDCVKNVYSDTILQKHTLDEEPPFALKQIAKIILGEWADKAQEALKVNIKTNGGKTTKDCMEMFKADTSILSEYCCWDVILTFKLFNIFQDRLEKENLLNFFYEEEVMPLYKTCTVTMKDKGFPIDLSYFQSLKTEIEQDIQKLENEIMVEIAPEISTFIQQLLDDEFPIKSSGNYPKALASVLGIPLPETKEGKISLAKKHMDAIIKVYPQYDYFYNWIMNGVDVPSNIKSEVRKQAQESLFFNKYSERKYIFNLKSNDHLGYLIYDRLGCPITERTDKGKPKIDDDALEIIADSYGFIQKLLDYKKLNKLSSTYIEGILDRQINGVIYTSMLQFGTTSGRYSSKDPNIQNLPRPKGEDSKLSDLVLKYTNAIRKGFVAPEGYCLVDMDYSALEPRCFAHMSGDKNLQKIFFSGEDMYSSIAKRVYNMGDEVSSFKKDQNFLGTLYPEIRQIIKALALAVTYGAEASRISDMLNIKYQEADKIVKDYLTAYPGLKKYMQTCDYEAKNFGQVKTQFGRVRHLKAARNLYLLYGNELLDYKKAASKGMQSRRREFKNLLNNAKNFKIQGLAAHIVNRCMIATQENFVKNKIDGYVALQVHDEIICVVKKEHSILASKILKECAENTIKISIPLIAEPKIARNWAEAK